MQLIGKSSIPVDIEIGTIIKFNTLNNKETTKIHSTVAGIVTAENARPYGDIVKYHQEVLESVPGAGLDPTPNGYTFILLSDHQGVKRVMAPEWIELSTLEEVATTNIVDIKVYGITDEEKQTVLNLLRDNGYTVL